MKKILYHSALFLLLASYTINVYAHCELDGLYHEGDTSVIGSHSQKNILFDNPIPNPDPYFPPDPVVPDLPYEPPTPTVDPAHPDIPTVSNSHAVGSPAGNLTVNGTGAAEYCLNIDCPNGGNLSPQIALAYNSQSNGYGLAGYGFSVTGISSITRGKKTLFHNNEVGGVTYTANDNLFLDGKLLILQSGNACQESAVYCLQGDPYTKVIVHGVYNNSTTTTWFEVKTSDGKTYQYGNSSNSRITYKNKKGNSRIASWYINKVEDVYGNYITYDYDISNLYAYLRTITYGLNSKKSRGITNRISFEYQSLGSNYSIFNIEDQKGKIDKCISSITTSCNDSIYRKYLLTYDGTSDQSMYKYNRLTKIQEQNGIGESLPPIQISWNYLPSSTTTLNPIHVGTEISNSFISEDDKSFLAIDMNGDGISDICRITYTTEKDGTGNTSNAVHLDITKSKVSSEGIISYSPQSLSYSLPIGIKLPGWESLNGGLSHIDFDGDGYNDLIASYYTKVFEDINKVSFYLVWGSEVAEGKGLLRKIDVGLKASSEMPLFVISDTDGDGKDEIFCVEKNPQDGLFPAFILKFKEGSTLEKKDFALDIESAPKKMFSGDYNNDGLADIILLYEGGYKVFLNNGGVESTQKFTNANAISGTNIANCYRIQQGDFDGDGLVDFVYNVSTVESMEGFLQVSRNNGDGTFTHMSSVYVDVWDQTTSKDDQRFAINVCDIDHDGKSDVMVSKACYHQEDTSWGFDTEWVYTCTRIKWLYSDGSTLKIVKSIDKSLTEDANEGRIFIGDFDGDGFMELANFGSDLTSTDRTIRKDTINVYKSSAYFSQTGRITRIVDGMGNKSDILYAFGTSPVVYTRTNYLNEKYKYPINTYTYPIPLVKNISSSNGIADNQTNEYSYKDLMVQMTGGGLLGFTEYSVFNTNTGEKTTTKITERQDKRNWLPRYTYITKTLGDKESWVSIRHRVVDINNTYFIHEADRLCVDYDGNTTIIMNEYDSENGCLLEHIEESDWDDMEIYKSVVYSDYVKKSGMWLPKTVIKEQKHTDDPSPYSLKTSFEYDDQGNVLAKVENDDTPMALTTTSTYDVYGNCLSSVSTGKGITGIREITEYNDYDPSGRFVIKTYQEPDATVNTFTYDIWGNLLTENDETEPSNILTTRHTYDKWGRLLSSVAPDGTKTESTTGWGNGNDKKYYVLEKKSETPWVLTWYDNAGHEVLQQTFGPKNVLISKATEYNEKGQVKKVTNVNGKFSMTESFTYDDLGRMQTDKLSSGKETTYSYGNRSVTTTIAGRSSTKTTDAWGNVKTSTDAMGNVVEYYYYSNGKPSSVTTNGSTVTMEYDVAGNQISLTDPDAGTITYKYAADGTLLEQTDARGVLKRNTYDALGRLEGIHCGGYTIKYGYGTSGYKKLRLTSKKLGVHNIQYDYDKYGRLVTEKLNIRAKGSYKTSYEYDTRNRLAKTIYPGGLVVEYQYDDYGHKIKTIADGKKVLSLDSYDGLCTENAFLGKVFLRRTIDANGYEKEAKLTKTPDISISKNGIDKGGEFSSNGLEYGQVDDKIFDEFRGGNFIIGRLETTIDQHDVNYDPLTDNLLARKRYNQNVEVFGYDDLDRLVSVSKSTAQSVTETGDLTETMSITYAPNGNILSKTGLGEYTYNSTVKPHAVMSVDNTDALISSDALNTEFNSFGKISSIEDDNRRLSFTYGPDLQRMYTTMTKDGQEERITVYAGNYEKITEHDITREFYYLDGGVIIVKENDEFKPYLSFTDNLGSILSVVDEDGTIVFHASYDAWGSQSLRWNPVNGLKMHRGYTGHEMLSEFGIINMNGRLYDPILGRFFSPDNYVQMPDFSQSFNRYSYCLNNPLKYNDPSGEFFHLIIGAAIGGMMNWMMHDCQWNAKGLGYFGVGAAAGFLSAGVGAGICSSLPVAGSAAGGFSAGFWGTSSATIATSSFVSGAAIGGITGISGGFITGFGNSLIDGNSFSKSLGQGCLNGLIGGAAGGLIGGVFGGLHAINEGRTFFNGWAKQINVIDKGHSIVGQNATKNCVGASCESLTDGAVTQDQVRSDYNKLVGRITNPNKEGMPDLGRYKFAAKIVGRQAKYGTSHNPQYIYDQMALGDDFGITYEVSSVDEFGDAVTGYHNVLMQKASQTTIIKHNGTMLIRQPKLWVMDPADGGSIRRIHKSQLESVIRVFQ